VLSYLRFVLDMAPQGLAAGVSPLEAARGTDLGEFTSLSDPERTSAICTALRPR
jgi:cyclase